MSTQNRSGFRIEWDLREFGPKPADEQPVYRDLSAQLDFSRFDYARAVAAGYVPANQRDIEEDVAA